MRLPRSANCSRMKSTTPVTLARRQQSAMLPIVNESVKGEKVAIYNPKRCKPSIR